MATSRKATSSRTCLCSPTSHPGSFRCSLHRKQQFITKFIGTTMSRSSNKLDVSFKNTTTTAATSDKSKVSLFKAFLMHVIIKPTNHHQKRIRNNFQPKPSYQILHSQWQSQSAGCLFIPPLFNFLLPFLFFVVTVRI
uniref:Uncharacterized protein LOC104239287 n=1 Tax=Nicotiana sylvestris TaxID=4096 RepID=A0A1U7XMS3_NICSY|nr:PREDICTED: uncharacterized protein LOC104239287 [Nicotiana sylvestris]